EPFDQALLLASAPEPLVLGITRAGSGWQLSQASAHASQPLATLESAEPAWLSACTDGARALFALGDGQRVQLGSFTPGARDVRLWSVQTAEVVQAIDPEQPQLDRVRVLCGTQAALLLVRERDRRLSALICRDREQSCHKLTLASDVSQFSALLGAHDVLIAYAGRDRPQVRVRSLDLAQLKLSAERVPAACWSKSGLCARPSLARLGERVVLAAPEGTDLLLLESADEGQSWSTPPVL
ncbi:MAG TPA: hypothetical protein VMF89_13195, partial [Polyangiales bacterium]|nr:hypothetical protein [Polyangiales bacterium]